MSSAIHWGNPGKFLKNAGVLLVSVAAIGLAVWGLNELVDPSLFGMGAEAATVDPSGSAATESLFSTGPPSALAELTEAELLAFDSNPDITHYNLPDGSFEVETEYLNPETGESHIRGVLYDEYGCAVEEYGYGEEGDRVPFDKFLSENTSNSIWKYSKYSGVGGAISYGASVLIKGIFGEGKSAAVASQPAVRSEPPPRRRSAPPPPREYGYAPDDYSNDERYERPLDDRVEGGRRKFSEMVNLRRAMQDEKYEQGAGR